MNNKKYLPPAPELENQTVKPLRRRKKILRIMLYIIILISPTFMILFCRDLYVSGILKDHHLYAATAGCTIGFMLFLFIVGTISR